MSGPTGDEAVPVTSEDRLEPARGVVEARQADEAGDVGAVRPRRSHLWAALLTFALSRLAFYVAALLGSGLLPHARAWPEGVRVPGALLLALHWRWDAVHYYTVAVNGYEAGGGLPAFFPLFPLLMRAIATLLGGFQPPTPGSIDTARWPPLLAGVLVVHGASLLAFWLLYELAYDETHDAAVAQRAVLYAAIFPFAFYYAVPYAEPLFLATSVGMFLAVRRGQWIRAGLWAAAASATRPMGILLAPALALEILLAWRRGALRSGAWLRAALALLLSPMGLLLFALHLWQSVGDPLAFAHAQASWNREQVFPLTTLWRGVSYMLQPSLIGQPEIYTRTVLNTLAALGFLAVTLVSLRDWRPSYVLFGALLFILSLSSPWPGATVMDSVGRYVMVLFPVYITLGGWGKRGWVHHLILLLWLPLFGLLVALYARWYWIG